MKLLGFILALFQRFIPHEEKDFAELKYELEKDWSEVITNPEHEGYKNDIKTKLKTIESNPWFRLGLAAMFFFAVKYIHGWLNPKPEPEQIDD